MSEQPAGDNGRPSSHPGYTQSERLAVLETLIGGLGSDIREIKDDVKALARAQAGIAADLATKTAAIATNLATETSRLATNLAVTSAADSAIIGSRASNGVWVRAIVPWFLAGFGTLLTLLVLTGVLK